MSRSSAEPSLRHQHVEKSPPLIFGSSRAKALRMHAARHLTHLRAQNVTITYSVALLFLPAAEPVSF